MYIHENFIGGNIKVIKQDKNIFFLDNNLRDTTSDWFYWAFCVEGAAGQTLTFQFRDTRLGYWGPAVSHDLLYWEWLGTKDSDCFTYSFRAEEDKVYFAHHMLYHPERFEAFAAERGLKVKTLAVSEKGRKIPYIELNNPKTYTEGNTKKIILTARHHACESTGNYILEGILDELARNPIEGYSIMSVPFVDYDGVIDGDQGKNRYPHDHNRDYTPDIQAIYASVAAIRKFIAEENVVFGFDFHAPFHSGGVRDTCFIVQKSKKDLSKLNRFGELFEACVNEEASQKEIFRYKHENDYPPDFGWNKSDAPTFAFYVMEKETAELAFTLETAYFGTSDNIFASEKVVETGRCFAKALRKYINDCNEHAPTKEAMLAVGDKFIVDYVRVFDIIE